MSDFPLWVADYVGIPYKALGREKDGLDCWGLLYVVQKEVFGLDIGEYGGVGFEKGCDRKALSEFMDRHRCEWERVAPGKERVGDGILLRAMGAPIHVGIVVAPGWMLHCEQNVEACIEQYTGVRWGRRVEGIYRYVGADR